ncbi:hypothetical protein [Arthrobacter sp. H14]|uniref:hypothetical protein n=1 Tax=Arthrobacter sp. H14 TaxID=1312959 RepID=UPI0012DFA890|nr:hypothetical protein [Arthrobacter sp. H14]
MPQTVMSRQPRSTRFAAAAVAGLLALGVSACTNDSPGPEPESSSPSAQPSSTPTQSAEPSPTPSPTAEPTAPAPGEAPEAGGVEVWATETLGREKGMYYGHGWMGGAATHTAQAPIPSGSYGVTLACQGDGEVDVVISEGGDAPDDAQPTEQTVTCSQSSTVAVELETDGMQLEFTAPDGIHLYAYKIFERTT